MGSREVADGPVIAASTLARIRRALRSIQGRAVVIALGFMLAVCAQQGAFIYSVGRSGTLIRDMAHDQAATEALDALSDSVREFGYRLIGTHGGIYAAPSTSQRVVALAERIQGAWQRVREALPIQSDSRVLDDAEAAIVRLPEFAGNVRSALAGLNPRLSEAERLRVERMHDEWLDILVPLRRHEEALRAHVGARAKRGLESIEATERLLAWVSGIALVAGLVAIMLAWTMLATWIARPTSRLAGVIGRLAAGDLDTTVPYANRGDEIGEIARAVAVLRQNARDKQELEQRASLSIEREREAASLQKRVLSIAAHEFRTPLTIIDGAAQRLLRNASDANPAELRNRVQRIRAAVARMSQLIDMTLDSARLGEGQLALELARLDLVALVAATCKRQQVISPDFDIRITSGAASLEVEADARLLEQVFTNLVNNAVKYSGASRRIEVAILCEEPHASISIRDFGIGIPADEIPKLFTRFFRASTAKGLPGTGIGLNLVKELVELHGGNVAVTSQLGQGTTFEVSLCIKPARAHAPTVA